MNFLVQLCILQNWYFISHQSSKIRFLYTNNRVLMLCTILSKLFFEKTICLAKKPHYATQMFTQPQQMSFFMNNRKTISWLEIPTKSFFYPIILTSLNFFSGTKSQNLHMIFEISFQPNILITR